MGGGIGDGVILKASCCFQQPTPGCCLFVLSCPGNMILQTGSRQTRQTGQMTPLLNSSPAFVPDQVVGGANQNWVREPFSWGESPRGELLTCILAKVFLPL